MVKFLLDTNVISELGKPKPHGAVLQWFKARSLSELILPSVALYEMQVGIELTARQDVVTAASREALLDQFSRSFKILPLDETAAREAARIMHGKSLDLLEDGMIAAIAKVNGLTVATRNTKDFDHFGVAQINPFLYRAP